MSLNKSVVIAIECKWNYHTWGYTKGSTENHHFFTELIKYVEILFVHLFDD